MNMIRKILTSKEVVYAKTPCTFLIGRSFKVSAYQRKAHKSDFRLKPHTNLLLRTDGSKNGKLIQDSSAKDDEAQQINYKSITDLMPVPAAELRPYNRHHRMRNGVHHLQNKLNGNKRKALMANTKKMKEYHERLHACATNHETQGALELISIKSKFHKLNVFLIDGLMEAFAKARMFDVCHSILGAVRRDDRKIKPGVSSLYVWMKELLKARDADGAITLRRQFKELGYYVHTEKDIRIVACCLQAPGTQSLAHLVSLAKQEESDADRTKIFNMAINLCCSKKKKGIEATPSQLLMVMKHLGLKPDSYSYLSLLDSYARSKDFEKSVKLWEMIQASDIEISYHCYTAVISACKETGRLDVAERVFATMQERGIPPTLCAYTALISCWIEIGESVKARAILDDFHASHQEEDAQLYTPFLSYYLKNDKPDSYQAILEIMKQRGTPHDTVSYAIQLKAVGPTGNINEVLRLMNEMRSKEIPVTVEVYRSLFGRLKSTDEDCPVICRGLLRSMWAKDRILPKDGVILCAYLIRTNWEVIDLLEVLAEFDLVQDQAKQINVKVIDTCLRNNRITETFKALQWLKSNTKDDLSSVMETLLERCLDLELWGDAVKALDLINQDRSVATLTYHRLVQGLIESSSIKPLKDLVRIMDEQGLNSKKILKQAHDQVF